MFARAARLIRCLNYLLVVLLLAVLLGPQVTAVHAAGTTLFLATTSNNGNDGNACTQGAPCATFAHVFGLAQPGDTISVGAGTFTEPNITIGKNLTINGAGAAQTTVNSGGHGRVFTLGGDLTAVTISNLTASGGLVSGSQQAGGGGGGVFVGFHTVATLNNVTVQGNEERGAGGGGIYNFLGTLGLTGCTVDSNTSSIKGAGIANAGGTVTISNSTITNNKLIGAESDGAGIINFGQSMTLDGTTVSNNTGARDGGGINNVTGSSMTITNSTIAGNPASNLGGGIYNDGDDNGAHPTKMSIRSSTVSGNRGPTGGGGIMNISILDITDSTITGNTTTNNGGGIYSNGTLTVASTTISGNHAVGGTFGGGLSLVGGTGAGTGTVLNSTIAGNDVGITGSALFVAGGAVLSVSYSTIAMNTGGNAGILATTNGTVNLRGALLVGNAGANCAGAVATQGVSLSTDASCPGVPTASLSLGPLSNNGGPTQTLALPAGSPAIDAGGGAANGCPATDQRGTTRPQGAACDIGAFELVPGSGGGGGGGTSVGLQFFPLPKPVRLLDTRAGQTAVVHPGIPLSANQALNLPGHFTTGGITVPAEAQALVGNATVDNSVNAPAGFATLYPSLAALPVASNLNFVPGTVRPNAITVGLGSDGNFNLFSSTGGNFIIDITGYFAPPATGGLFFHPLSQPVRLLDTRAGQTAVVHPNAAFTPGQTLSLPGQFTANGITVPASAKALAGNATVDNSVGAPAGFATLFPGGTSLPPTSNLNFAPGTVAPNAFTVGLGGDGSFNLFSNTGGNFILDVTGYYDAVGAGGLLFYALGQPVRELDTRAGQAAFKAPGAPLAAKATLNLPGSFAFSGVTIPAGAKALVGNATVDNSINAPDGFATLFPGGTTLPLASNLNYSKGTVAPNAFIVGVGSDGTYNLYSLSGGNFIIDIAGYFAAGTGTSAAKT